MTDTFGRQLTFTYGTNGLADTMTDANGKVYQFTYIDRSMSPTPPPATTAGGFRVLSTVVYPDANPSLHPTLTYLYEDTLPINRFALTGILDEKGQRYATWTFDSAGRVTSSQSAGGADLTSINYTSATTRTVTNALGKQDIYNLSNSGQLALQIDNVAGQASANTAASTTSYAYDANGYISQITYGNGNVNKYTHNAVGQETSRTEGFGSPVARTITTTWNSTWRAPNQITEPNVRTNFTYDGTGRLSQLTKTDTTTHTVPYSTNGQTRTWTFTYSTAGLVATVDGPLAGSGDTTTYGYNAAGFVNSITNVLGQVTTVSSINGRGQPLTSVDANSITTNFTYDDLGRVLSVTVNPGANQSQTGFTYDLAGNLTVITRPDGSTLTYAYDNAHRPTSVTNNTVETITYTLNALGNRTATVTRTAGGTITQQQSATFDELGRVMANLGAASQTTTHSYDLNNNETSTTDPRSKVYGHAFDALNRLYRETDPDSFQTSIAFNAQDDVVSVTDARSLVTAYVRNGFGDVIRQTSPDTGITDFWYDANGAVTKQIDARAVQTDFTNDNAGRVLTKTFPAASAENVTYTYDSTAGGNKGVGMFTSVTDQSGSTSFVYNALGQATSDTRVIGGNSYGTAYTYDPAGNTLTETYPSGRIVTYARDSLGRVSGVTTKQNSGSSAVTVASGVTYKPFGPLAGFTFGNGAVLTRTYDQDYQLTDIDAAAGTTVQDLTNGYDPAGNITSITDHLTSARTQTVTYDNLNRVATAGGVYGSQGYTYDGVGNRLTRVIGGTTDTYAYSPTANRVSTVTTGANVRSLTYAASGQVSGDVRDSAHTYGFTINNNGRNAAASLNSSGVGAYLYNAFEQRVQKTASGTVTQFVYDSAGHLIAEANGSGVAQKEYIWIDDLPVAMVDNTGGSPVLYYIHTDQLGTPQKISDGSLNIVWDGVFDPFGNPATGASLSLTNVRFPGQYSDSETVLNQNWMRDYDPTTGRYVQSDPIALDGGANTYTYAGGNPVIYVDSTGEFFFLPALIGAGIGGVSDIGIQLLLNGGDVSCIKWGQVAISAGLGAVGGGLGSFTRIARYKTEFSHWIPTRYIRPSTLSGKNLNPSYIRTLDVPGVRDFINGSLNGNCVAASMHALTDPFRYTKGMTAADKLSRPLQQLLRVPAWLGGSTAGSAIGGANSAADTSCGCN